MQCDLCSLSRKLRLHDDSNRQDYTVGPEKLKKPKQKNSWNQIVDQFHQNILTNAILSISCYFKNGEKSIFELGKSF